MRLYFKLLIAIAAAAVLQMSIARMDGHSTLFAARCWIAWKFHDEQLQSRLIDEYRREKFGTDSPVAEYAAADMDEATG